jgi:hypothetical protein
MGSILLVYSEVPMARMLGLLNAYYHACYQCNHGAKKRSRRVQRAKEKQQWRKDAQADLA